MKQDIIDLKGKTISSIELPKEIFGVGANHALIAQVITSYLANRRHGTASTKTRGEVAGSTRKLYRQKGTGRARAGSVKSPVRVGGGIAFGPKPRDYGKKITQKIKKKALYITLSTKLKDKKIQIIDSLDEIGEKTKQAHKVLTNLYPKNINKTKLLLITDNNEDSFMRAVRNLPYIERQKVDGLNAYQVLGHTDILFTKHAIQRLTKQEPKKGAKEKN